MTRRSGKRCVVLMRQACHLRLRTAVYHWARIAIQHDARSRARYVELRKRLTAMAAPCAVSPIAYSPSPAPCSKAKQPSIQNMLSRPLSPDLRPIPWFDRENHPFVPTCLPAERRAIKRENIDPKYSHS